ncbi:helix-turn-helix domain-containing protein [Streptomyces mutabilis]|uniref:helix-turn-helix domain-containing protein n=1 Tax=Streptomyces mutabilis TaxID=67332 RepID=UPI001AE08793|nr:helix-turn-helix domain-containing protein [Streptomyces mutabilis]
MGLLGDVGAEGLVPDLILRSWRRSISNSVDGASPCRRQREIDTDSVLCRAAGPVLDRWQQHLADTGTTLFLSDRAGNIVARRADGTRLRRRLDRVHAAEGFDYSEESVGTNGLGTSILEGRAVYVQGSQHYNDALSALVCAAVPVRTPAGAVIGSLSLGAPIAAASRLMVSLTKEIGQQIEERLRQTSRPQDLALAMSFMRFANSRRPTLVMDHESLLANTPGLPYVSVHSHVMLWELLNSHDWSRGDTARFLLNEATTEAVAHQVLDGPRAHFVLHFHDLGQDGHAHDRASASSGSSDRTTVSLPDESRCAVALVEGPPGSGRATAARTRQRRRSPETPLWTAVISPHETTPWTDITQRLSAGSDVLVRRIENIAEHETPRLSQLVAEQRSPEARHLRGTLWLTACRSRAPAMVQRIVDQIGPCARTEALARTPERIPELVKCVLREADPQGRRAFSPTALQALIQWDWPGNLTELHDTVTELVEDVSGSVIQHHHLPRHLKDAPPRRRLGLIEEAERDAIIKALDAAAGNKSEAAALLGIGRTTLYRRLRQLGLEGDESALHSAR